MRVIICGPQKTGNHWIQSILVNIYGFLGFNRVFSLEELSCQPDHSISIQHFYPDSDLLDLDAKFFTILRDPYDVFVSLFYYVNNFSDNFINSPEKKLIGKKINDNEVLDYLANDFFRHLYMGMAWKNCPRTYLLTYESLHSDPLNVIRPIANIIGAKTDDVLTNAIEQSAPENMKKYNDAMNKHVRKAIVGDWKNHLNENHLKVFQERHKAAIEVWGYVIR